MTETELKYYKVPAGSGEVEVLPYDIVQHQLSQIPLIEYKNNRFGIGDFAQQIGLIDAYNTMTADRINDKEQFIDAILVIYGAMLGETEKESDEALENLKAKKLLELPDDKARAEYLTRQLDENGMEVLRDALKEDIYTFSHVPNLTDENFAGNSSGVAMEYKLLGLEMLTKTKERWYRRGLRKRIEIFLYFLGLKGAQLDESDIEITFSRALPKNLLELSQIVNYLADDLTLKTRLSLLPFIEDPEAEAEAVEAEKQANVIRQQEFFASTSTESGQQNDEPEDGAASGYDAINADEQ
jgi:SPP1 family phage portal protein